MADQSARGFRSTRANILTDRDCRRTTSRRSSNGIRLDVGLQSPCRASNRRAGQGVFRSSVPVIGYLVASSHPRTGRTGRTGQSSSFERLASNRGPELLSTPRRAGHLMKYERECGSSGGPALTPPVGPHPSGHVGRRSAAAGFRRQGYLWLLGLNQRWTAWPELVCEPRRVRSGPGPDERGCCTGLRRVPSAWP